MEASIPTPKLIKEIDYLKVYEPSEDTFTLMDALEKYLTTEKLNNIKPKICLEVGVGCGMVLSFLGKLLKSRYYSIPLLLGTDINPYALKVCKENSKLNQVDIDVINCDLCHPLLKRLEGKIDILIFNPPYVETEDNEIYYAPKIEQIDELFNEDKNLFEKIITATWAGGKNGRLVIDKFFKLVEPLLSYMGQFFLVTIQQNKPLDLIKNAYLFGLIGEVVLIRTTGREKLHILRFCKVGKQI